MSNAGQPADADEWEFELEQVVTLLWLLDTTGQVIGRSEFIHEDDKYLVEFVGSTGRLERIEVYGDALDRVGATH